MLRFFSKGYERRFGVLMVAAILILSLDEHFPMGFGLVLSCVFPVLSFLKARNLGAGSFRGPPFGSPLPVLHTKISHGCCHSPLSVWGGGEREREEKLRRVPYSPVQP